MLDWVRERLVIPEGEWRRLLHAIEGDLEDEASVEELVEGMTGKAVRLDRADGAEPVVVAVESLPRLFSSGALDRSRSNATSLLGGEPFEPSLDTLLERLGRIEPTDNRQDSDASEDPFVDLLAEWLRFYGPIGREGVEAAFDVSTERLGEALAELVEGERLVIDRFGPEAAEGEPELCDAENLERLLRILRSSRRPAFEPLPLERLPLLLAAWQGLNSSGGLRELQEALEALFGASAPAALWESDILPARLDPYYPSWLDSLLQESDLTWTGSGKEKLDLPLSGRPRPSGAVGVGRERLAAA